jgi:hypothetical protein
LIWQITKRYWLLMRSLHEQLFLKRLNRFGYVF